LGVKSKQLNNNLGIQLSPRHFCRGLFCFQEITTKESKSLNQNRYTNKISFFGKKLNLFFSQFSPFCLYISFCFLVEKI
jgi:hypothetical protein